MNYKKLCILAASAILQTATAQNELYPQHFVLSEVTLLDSPFKTAMEKNFDVLLSYNHYRLLTPYIRQAGLTTGDYAGWETKYPSFANWGAADFNLDGHVGGHYLTALSLAYAACRDADTKAALKTRVDYMVSVMKNCQAVYDDDATGLKGFIGGQPMNAAWQRLYSNQDITLKGTGECAVPWYCQHKILAGLRDAYVYTGNTDAKTVFLKLCDWCILVTSTLNDEQMEAMLGNEHGGVNETLLDAYKLTGESKYLTAAKHFTHKSMVNGMQSLPTTFLDNKHANTQVPKYIGMERIAEVDASATTYQTAAENFWTDVAQNRTVCIGGNSMYEHFLAASNAAQYINHADGPESCNTNNMLKLSEMAFDRTHDAKYADFYEYGMWNHILSTQDPTTGGYVYFTTLRPQGYRIYSTVNEAMWCCVGTGMENHSKYGHFIYTHVGTSKLYVNLFTASELDNANFKIKQETSFPFANTSTLTVQKAGDYTIAIRHPQWAADGYAIAINGYPLGISVTKGTASYVEINRTWSENDVITVTLPMELRYTPCPNYTDYIAFQYGPILLAAQTSTSNEEEAATKHLRYEASLQNEYGHEGRMDHAPSACGKSLSLTSAPLLIGNRDGENGVLSKITTSDLSRLQFTLDARTDVMEGYTWTNLTLQPFYQIHHARYACYWYQQTAESYANSSMAAEEAAKAAIAARTLDFVGTGEQQSEAGHVREFLYSGSGSYNDEFYRDASSGGYIQYTLSYEGEAIASGLSVFCRFTQADGGRKATLYVDGEAIANIQSLGEFNGADEKGFYNVEYPIPAHLMRDASGNIKKRFVVRLSADKGTNAPGLYYIRLMKEYNAGLPATVTTTAGAERTVIDGVVTGENGQSEMSHGFTFTGNNDGNNHGTYQEKYWRCAMGGEYYGYDLQTNGTTDGVSLVVEYFANDYQRLADISIDGVTFATQEISQMRDGFIVMEYPIDPVLLKEKKIIHVQFTSVGGKYTAGSYNIYLTSDRNDASLGLTPYTFLNTNFEKNGGDGNISSITYNDGAMQIASGGGNNSLNMRMKKSVSGTYSIMPNQYLLTVKGQKISTTVASLWWIMGCNHGATSSPTYTKTDGDDIYLIWDLRRVGNFTDTEKNARFFGTAEVAVSTSDGGDYSLLCMGLTSTADDHSAVISDISSYSPEQLVDKYAVLKSTVNSMATGLAANSRFAYDGYLYTISSDNTKATLTGKLSTAADYSRRPATLFGYTVDATEVLAAETNKQTILNAGGDATSLIQNADCNVADGWTTNSGTAGLWGGQNWRGTGDGNDKYLDVGGAEYVQQTLTNMPAGYYKMVAAVRAESSSCTITPKLNESAGNSHTGLTSFGGSGVSMINTQGVQMIADADQHGYSATANTRGWQWSTASTRLETAGDLTIRFNLSGAGWKCVDDVHLYYSETEDGFYTITDATNDVDASKVLTCDIILNNPNTIIISDAAVTTASGDALNNNLVSGTVSNLVLFDGKEFSAPSDFTATNATLYRKISNGAFATICAPFAITCGVTGTFYQPESLSDAGVLNFESVEKKEAGKAYLLKATADVTALTGSGMVKASPVDNGAGVTMKGTYNDIAAISEGDYVLSGTNLYKVNSLVTLAPFRAFFTIPGVAPARINLTFDDETTSISIITNSQEQNTDRRSYDLQGRLHSSLKKGFYVVNGKKIIK